MTNPLNIGLIGLDTSHVTAFTELLNQPGHEHHIPGGKVTCAFPGGSPDFPLSHSRVPRFTSQLQEQFGVRILGSPREVAESSDLVFLESVDGRVHRAQFEEIAAIGKPTFIDKPFALTSADAEAILELAARNHVPVMSSSALRFADNFAAAQKDDDGLGDIAGIDTYGPMAIQPTQPGFFWYGIHAIEMMVAALGAGCRRVRVTTSEKYDLITASWDNDRSATYRGLREAHGRFGAVIHRQKGVQYVDIGANLRPFYASLLEAIMASLPAGKSAVPAGEMLEVVRIIEAANQSRETGVEVTLA